MSNPSESSILTKTRAGLILAACIGLAGAVIFMIGYWVIGGFLEDWETLVAGGVFILIMAGIAALARRGRVRLAAWILVILLTALIGMDASAYGLGTPTVAMFVIPIVLSACCLGLWAGLGTAAFSTLVIWLIAWASTTGRLPVEGAVDISHFTFNAPALTILFIVTALIVGVFTHKLSKALPA